MALARRPSGSFASKTKVKPEKTRVEIEALLRANRAIRILTMDEPRFFVVGFVVGERWYKIEIGVDANANDQVRRAKWRALLLVIKAKLEAVAQKISTVEDEFMASAVMPNGRPVREWIEPQIAAAYKTGQMPPLQPDYSQGAGN